MELRQRKRIQNLPTYNTGDDGIFNINPIYNGTDYNWNYQDYTQKDIPVWKSPAINDPNADAPALPQPKEINGITDYGGAGKIDKDGMSFANKASAVANGVTSIAQGIIGNLSVKSQGELLADAGRYNGTIMGVGYQGQNNIDKDSELSSYDGKAAMNTLSSTASGASAGASFGPIGAVVGGAVGLLSGIGSWIGGKNKLRKRINNARNFATRTNIANKAGAITTGLQNEYYSNNAYTQDDILYG